MQNGAHRWSSVDKLSNELLFREPWLLDRIMAGFPVNHVKLVGGCPSATFETMHEHGG